MARARSTENRGTPRHGVALRVTLRDGEPPLHAVTRNIGLGGMYLMTATRRLDAGRECIATVEIDPGRHRWSPPLPVRVVWSHQTTTGVAFEGLTPAAAHLLQEVLDEARARRKRVPARHRGT